MSFSSFLRPFSNNAKRTARATMSRNMHTSTFGSHLRFRTNSMFPEMKKNTFQVGKLGGKQQLRFLNLHEYQSKELLATHGVRVQSGKVATSAEEASQAAEWLRQQTPDCDLILKAQIHAGGRGKGAFDNGFKGGVKVCSDTKEVGTFAGQMIGANLITHQTDANGQLCEKVLVTEGIDFNRELYFAILMDRAYNGPVIVCSKEGGVDIEDVFAKTPDAIAKFGIDITTGPTDELLREVAVYLGFDESKIPDVQGQIKGLYNMFIATDATQVEINPFVVASDGLAYCVDAKINFDDNASFRQKAIYAMRDEAQEDAREVAAGKHDLNYIGLDGTIGCMVNGAGLAMATMDIIQLHGGSPANFLDVGGGATEGQVEEAFKILSNDEAVNAILVNIFGGIMKCDVIANGIVNAAKKIGLNIPLVVRLEGTNVELGNKILQESGLAIVTASDLDDAAVKAVNAV